MERPVRLFYGGVIGFVVGVFIQTLTPLALPAIAFVSLIAFVLAIFYIRHPQPSTLWLTVLLLSAVVGMLRTTYEATTLTQTTPSGEFGEVVTLTGYIAREPDVRSSSVHLYVQTDDDLVLVFADPYTAYEYGEQILVRGELSAPESFTTEYGRTFNYPGYLAARGVRFIVRDAIVETAGEEVGNPLLAYLYTYKHAFLEQIEQAIPQPAAGLGAGVLLGVKQALGPQIEEMFRRTGIIHIVVLSGYNVMLVVTFITFILTRFFRLRLRVFFGLMGIALFALLVGLSATVLRASIMAALLLYAQATGRIYSVVRALFVAGILMLAYQPYLLVYDIGFQLSFMATLGLILLAPAIERRLSLVPAFLGVRSFLTATIAAQIAVLPLLLYQIGQFSVVAVVVNVLILPMVPVAMLLTALTGALGFVSSSLGSVAGFGAYLSLQYIIAVAVFFGAPQAAAFVVPAFPFWLVPLGYLAIGYVLYRLEWRATDPLAGWTIEEVAPAKQTAGTAAAVPAEVPIFFRD